MTRAYRGQRLQQSNATNGLIAVQLSVPGMLHKLGNCSMTCGPSFGDMHDDACRYVFCVHYIVYTHLCSQHAARMHAGQATVAHWESCRLRSDPGAEKE